MLKLDAAADVHHERLSVLRQAFEDRALTKSLRVS